MIRMSDDRRPRPRRKNGTMKYTVLLVRGNDGGFVATVPALPGCASQGRTRPAAIRNIKEAVEAYIEALIEDGLPVPREVDKDILEVEVAAR
mgnify:CR=1 FL=1